MMDDEISFDKIFKLGVDEIDSQHQFFVELLKMSMEASDTHDNREELGYLLQRLLLYAEFHFKTEEGIMSRQQYPGLGDHKKIHAELSAEAERLYQEWAQGTLIKTHLVQFMWSWLVNHIGSIDRAFGEYLQAAES